MHELSFYRQRRYDGGDRSGIEFDGNSLLSRFVEGSEEEYQDDPLRSALLWYVDIVCLTSYAISNAEEARERLRSMTAPIVNGLKELAERLRAGADRSWPLQWSIPKEIAGDEAITIVCSCINRIGWQGIAGVLSDTASNWSDILDRLEPIPFDSFT